MRSVSSPGPPHLSSPIVERWLCWLQAQATWPGTESFCSGAIWWACAECGFLVLSQVWAQASCICGESAAGMTPLGGKWSSSESWRKDVEIEVFTWGGGRCCCPHPTPPQHGQGSSLSLGKGKRLMFKDQPKVEVGAKRLPRFSHTCVWPWRGGCRWLVSTGMLT